jgi:hypothetical protein
MEKLPSFKEEPMMPDEGVYLSKIIFWATGDTWNILNKQMLTSTEFGERYHYRTGAIKNKVREITSAIHDSTEIVKRISWWIKTNIEWNNVRDFFSDPPEEILERRRGSSGDINLMLSAMLSEAGINNELVLISTRENGFAFEDIFALEQFDYVLCLIKLGGKNLFLDATERFLPYNLIPPRCLNYKGFVVSKDNPRWIAIVPPGKEKVTVTEDITLSEDLSANGLLTITADDYLGFAFRKVYSKELAGEMSGTAIDSVLFHSNGIDAEHANIGNVNEYDRPVIIEKKIEGLHLEDMNGNRAYLDVFSNLIKERNPFISPTREYPIEFPTPIDHSVIVQITLPDNYIVEDIPKSKAITLSGNGAKFSYNISTAGPKIIVAIRFQILSTIILQHEYGNLRELYSSAIAKQAERLVLMRK